MWNSISACVRHLSLTWNGLFNTCDVLGVCPISASTLGSWAALPPAADRVWLSDGLTNHCWLMAMVLNSCDVVGSQVVM